MENRVRLTVACGIALMLGVMSLMIPTVNAQVQQSGGPGSSVTLQPSSNIAGKVGIDQTTDGTTNRIFVGNIPHVVVDTAPTTAVTLAALPALAAGTANAGIVRAVPSSCTQSTPFANTTVGVATGAGTSVTSTATCVTLAYANNITNLAVVIRVQDKSGTPIIWVGGGTDFSIPPNSNVRIPLDGVTFVGGITAIAGTGSAVNLQINGLQ